METVILGSADNSFLNATRDFCNPSRRWRLAVAVAVSAQLLLSAGPSFAEEDHLKGYKIKDLNKVAPPLSSYTLNSATFGSENCELKKPLFFLVPNEKNGADDGRAGAAGEFVCYKAKCAGALPPVTDRDSQFGLHSLQFKKAQLVCLPVAPACDGQYVGGACWFLGAPGASCDATCAAQGMTCAPATINYAGTGGTLENCDAVLDALLGPGTTSNIPLGGPGGGIGCFVLESTGQRYRDFTEPTTCVNVLPGPGPSAGSRACACAP